MYFRADTVQTLGRTHLLRKPTKVLKMVLFRSITSSILSVSTLPLSTRSHIFPTLRVCSIRKEEEWAALMAYSIHEEGQGGFKGEGS